MADYSVDIQGKLSGFEKLDEYERKIKELDGKTIDIKINVPNISDAINKGISTSSIKGVGKTVAKQVSSSVGSGVASNIGKIFKTTDLQKQGKMYFSKVQNTLENMIPSIESKFSQKGYSEINVTKGVEDATGKVKSFTVTARDATGALKQFNFEKAKLQGNGKAQGGFIQQGDVKVFRKPVVSTPSATDIMEQAKDVSKSVTKKDYDVQIASLFAKKGKLYPSGDAYDTLAKSINVCVAAQNELNSAVEKFNANQTDVNAKNVIDKQKALQEQISISSNNAKIATYKASESVNPTELANFQKRVNKYYTENEKMQKKYGQNFQNILTQLNSPDLTSNEFKRQKALFASYTKDVSLDGLEGKSFFAELGRGAKAIGQFAYTYGVIQNFQNKLIDSIGELKDVDSILTEISKTSDLTDDQINDLGKTSFDKASKWGKSAADYLTGVQEMSRSGYYGKDAENMANLSVLAQASGDLNANVANSYLLASNAAYDYKGNVEKLNAVLDGQNEITNRNSVSMQDMADATTKAASMASEMGVKENQLSAMIGTIEASTKAGGEEVGTGIKSLLINLQNINNSKIVGTLEKAGISMTEMVNGAEKMRDPISILEDLQAVFNGLDESDPLRSEILTNIGQKYHANQLSALLSGWDDYKKMLDDYADGQGSAAEEAEKSANNWEGSVNKLNNSFTKLVGTFANSDIIIGGANALRGLFDVLNSFTGFSPAGPILTIVGAVKGLSALKNLDGLEFIESKKYLIFLEV